MLSIICAILLGLSFRLNLPDIVGGDFYEERNPLVGLLTIVPLILTTFLMGVISEKFESVNVCLFILGTASGYLSVIETSEES